MVDIRKYFETSSIDAEQMKVEIIFWCNKGEYQVEEVLYLLHI